MIRTDELRKSEGQIQVSLAALEGSRLGPKARAINEDLTGAKRAAAPYVLNLTGSQLLVGLMFGLCLVSLFTWGFVRHVLFAQ